MESHNSTSLKATALFIALFHHDPHAKVSQELHKSLLQFSLPRIICPTPISNGNGSGALKFFVGAPVPPLVLGGIFRGKEWGMDWVWRAELLG